jgi:hypothetical protein
VRSLFMKSAPIDCEWPLGDGRLCSCEARKADGQLPVIAAVRSRNGLGLDATQNFPHLR